MICNQYWRGFGTGFALKNVPTPASGLPAMLRIAMQAGHPSNGGDQKKISNPLSSLRRQGAT
jgi:hypothetical protein